MVSSAARNNDISSQRSACSIKNFFIILTVLSLIFIGLVYNLSETNIINHTNRPESSSVKLLAKSGMWGCPLPKIDPFDPKLKGHVEWKFAETYRDCNKDFKKRSTYKNGTIEMNRNKEFCQGRCFQQVTYHRRNTENDWKTLNDKTEFNCEYVEVACKEKENSTDYTYTMLHVELKKIKEKPNKKLSHRGKKYSVYIFVLDSTGNSAVDRNLVKTLHFMEKSFEAVRFPYINKVGLNSRPNAVAWFMGKQIEPIDRGGMGIPSIKEDWDYEESCKRYMDNESSIFQDYRDEGYRTMLTDDWRVGILNYPNCKGWKEPVVDHTMDVLIEQTLSAKQKKNYYGSNCVFLHREDLNYLRQFMDAYPDEPQFALTWMAEIVHDRNEGAMIMDTDIMLFLMENRAKLEDSFVFFMADHGNRVTSIIWTDIGQKDNRNPMLFLSIPKELRIPETMAMLRENAGKLQTHYDTRATLIDILKFQPSVNFTDRHKIEMVGEKGHSFFRRYEGERSCATLPIPFSYCLCDYPQEELNKTSEVVILAGNSLINHVNTQLKDGNMTECRSWEFGQIELSMGYSPVNATGAMKLIVSAKRPYSKARLSALVHRTPEGNFTVGQIERADKYGNRGWCAPGKFEAICDCNNNTIS